MNPPPLALRVTPFELPLAAPFVTAGVRLRERRGFVLELRDDEHRGAGEATPLAGWTEPRARAGKALHDLEPTPSPDVIRERLAGWTDLPAARHALHQAWLDLRARRTNTPMYRALGGSETVESVPVNGVVGDAGPEATFRRVQNLLDRGFHTVKIKVGARSRREDRRRLEVLNDLDRDVSLRLDANGAWSREDVRHLLPLLETLPLEYLEQPLEPRDLSGHAELRKRVPVALDESLREASTRSVLQNEAADAAVIKPMAEGGLDRARRRALAFHREGVVPVVGGTVDGAIARMGALHLAASLPVRRPAGLATGDRFHRDLIAEPPAARGGRLTVPAAPGLGPLSAPEVEGGP